MNKNERTRANKNLNTPNLKVKFFWPVLHAGLDLHLLVAREDDPDVNIAGVRLLLPQEVVHPRLDVVSKPSCLEPLRCEPILLTRASSRLVATLTLEPGKQQWIADHDEDLINLCEYWETYSRQIFSKWRTQTWWTFLPQSVHSTNGSTSRMSFFVDLNSDLAMCLHYMYYNIMFPQRLGLTLLNYYTHKNREINQMTLSG